jgi:predicted NAD-dependent protein-ADP-ribosyltransferase YbiA (DUF1768 family)
MDHLSIFADLANDKYWGDGGDGTGKNMLGYSLEIVRNELRRGNLLPAWPGAPQHV